MTDKEREPGDQEPKSGTTDRSLAGAADRLREAARWLVISFGAVAAVVFAGITVSRFGDLDPGTAPGLFILASASAIAALAGALGALLVAVSLAAASSVSLQELLRSTRGPTKTAATAVAADPLLSPWNNSLRRFSKDLRGAHDLYHGELRSWREDVERGSEYVDRAAFRLTELSRTQQEIQHAASFLRLQARFSSARWWLGGLLALASLGAIVFAWATGPEASESVPDAARSAVWSVSADDRNRVASALGEACGYDLAVVPIVIIATEDADKEADVITVPDDGCAAVRLVVATSELQATPLSTD